MHARARPGAVAALLAVVVSVGPVLLPAMGQEHQRAQVPGEVDGRVTEATIRSTICTRGYTAKVRPPRRVTNAIKRRLAKGLPGSPTDYELGHLIPIGFGGHPRSLRNRWLQTWPAAAAKDQDELRLPRAVCSGRRTLDRAQHEMLATWGPRYPA